MHSVRLASLNELVPNLTRPGMRTLGGRVGRVEGRDGRWEDGEEKWKENKKIE